jgi:hypothetical protein
MGKLFYRKITNEWLLVMLCAALSSRSVAGRALGFIDGFSKFVILGRSDRRTDNQQRQNCPAKGNDGESNRSQGDLGHGMPHGFESMVGGLPGLKPTMDNELRVLT